MIARLEVEGFKSLNNFAVDFEPFTVFIGPNSAGKSNILDALALLSRLCSQTIAESFKKGRGRSRDQFTRHGSKATNTMRFAVELLAHGSYSSDAAALQSRFRYELTIQVMIMPSGAERLVARDERLRGMSREEDTWIKTHPTSPSSPDTPRPGRLQSAKSNPKRRLRASSKRAEHAAPLAPFTPYSASR